MISQILNWRTTLAIVAILIVSGTIFYSNFLSKKLATDERKKVSIWAESLKTKSLTTDQSALNLTSLITNENTEIPIIETDEFDNPTGNFLNIDTTKTKDFSNLLKEKIIEFKKLHDSIKVDISTDPLVYNKYYYGDSDLLKQVRYYPMIQLFIVALFIFITLITISIRNKSTQNQVWAGMAKEAAHQLGTPISSLHGWLEMLKENPDNNAVANEISKDIDRLKLVSDRFGKIGSTPQLEPMNIVLQIDQMMNYIKRRSSEKINFSFHTNQEVITALINAPLFDWVIENLLKNSLDALDPEGSISIDVKNEQNQIIIDVTDNGKGISKKNLPFVFKPGFSTKKRGWGIGLSLSKRIIEYYHKGQLFVKNSEIGKGTTFRILLKK
jgi:signal transduction histidine kinase